MDYTINGDANKGWVQLLNSGQFQILTEMLTLSVICIGGGGGGFDGRRITLGHAGDGGFSKFLNIRAEGGKGGAVNASGSGGNGNYVNGQDGDFNASCSKGGSCYGYSDMFDIFCGRGGYSYGCNYSCFSNGKHDNMYNRFSIIKNLKYKTLTCGVEGASFGGGAAGFRGGAGGGGGFSCGMIEQHDYPHSRIVDVVVGKGGIPSHSQAGSGMVLVTWGIGDVCALAANKLREIQ